jgi:CBS domain-containing protein
MKAPVISTEPDIPVRLAYRKMVENEIRRLPVIDDEGHLVGILTERSARSFLLPRDLDASGVPADDDDTPVRKVMDRTVFVVGPEESIVSAVRTMHDRKVGGLPVVERGRCIGMITVQDLLEVLLAALEGHRNEVTEDIIGETLGARTAASRRS